MNTPNSGEIPLRTKLGGSWGEITFPPPISFDRSGQVVGKTLWGKNNGKGRDSAVWISAKGRGNCTLSLTPLESNGGVNCQFQGMIMIGFLEGG